jgi:hypothetical protein
MGKSSMKPSFEKSLVKDLHMRWRYTMMAMGRCSSEAAGPGLQKITMVLAVQLSLWHIEV